MPNLKLSAPWVTMYRMIEAMFGDDPDVRVEYAAGDGEDPIVRLYVEGQDKADAIGSLLPGNFDFGEVSMAVVVIPANRQESKDALFRRAFEGNPAFSYAVTAEGVFTNPITYVVFRNKVVQFWNDNLGDINGNETTLYEEIANALFVGIEGGICYCTDTPENVGMPAAR